ncbi:hypothetical protein WCT67_20665 [Pectobacterium parvum]|uniref:Uncharacterized protein n=1 Tax=Pectobacterium parvum TaxID=2778550 RepID=A0ABW8FW54_9GAMM
MGEQATRNSEFHEKVKKATQTSKKTNEASADSFNVGNALTEKEFVEAEDPASPEEQDIANLKRGQAVINQRMLAHNVELLHGKVKLQQQQLDMRKTYASKAYRFVWMWSIALIVILILQGSSYPTLKIFFITLEAHNFNLDNSVIIALISGVTVNIVAVFVVVIRNLFPSESKDDVENDKEKRTKKKNNKNSSESPST